MAVVEKKPETQTTSAFDRLGMASLAGVVYVLGSLAVAFKAVPAACELVGLDGASYVLLRGLLSLLAFVVLAVVGVRLMGGRQARPGLRAGIFLGLVFVLLWALLSRWVGGILEESTYNGWLQGLGANVGAGISLALSLALGYWLLKIFL